MYNFFIKKTHFREKILGKMKENCSPNAEICYYDSGSV